MTYGGGFGELVFRFGLGGGLVRGMVSQVESGLNMVTTGRWVCRVFLLVWRWPWVDDGGEARGVP